MVFLPDATGASRCQCGSKINPLTGFSAFCDEALTVPYTSAIGTYVLFVSVRQMKRLEIGSQRACSDLEAAVQWVGRRQQDFGLLVLMAKA